jgi:hypothetical protein
MLVDKGRGAGHTPETYLQDVQSGTARRIGSEGKYLWTVGEQGLGIISTDGKNL